MVKPLCVYFLLFCCVFVVNCTASSRDKRSILGFGRMVKKLTGRNPLDYHRYGNWCGLGGKGPPVDGVDRCCKIHDECYGEHNMYPECQGILFNLRAYFSIYDWDYDEELHEIACSIADIKCRQIVCNCDKTCAECFAQNTYHPHYKRSLFRRNVSENKNVH